MEKLYTVKQVAELLGFAEITIRQWIQHGKIESIKIGRGRRIPESEISRLKAGGQNMSVNFQETNTITDGTGKMHNFKK